MPPGDNASDALSRVGHLPARVPDPGGQTPSRTVAWTTAGGTGEPPEDLVLAFALNFSAFTTQALMVDFDQTPSQIGALTADLLKMLLGQAVEQQRSSQKDRARDAGGSER